MRIRSLITMTAAVAVLAVFAAAPISSNASSAHQEATPAATVAATTCTDSVLVAMVAGDAKAIGASLNSITATSTAADVYAFMVKVSDARIKYEDMDTPADEACANLSYEAMVWFADIGDLGQVILAGQLKLDSANLDARTAAVIARVKKQTTYVTDLLPAS